MRVLFARMTFCSTSLCLRFCPFSLLTRTLALVQSSAPFRTAWEERASEWESERERDRENKTDSERETRERQNDREKSQPSLPKIMSTSVQRMCVCVSVNVSCLFQDVGQIGLCFHVWISVYALIQWAHECTKQNPTNVDLSRTRFARLHSVFLSLARSFFSLRADLTVKWEIFQKMYFSNALQTT